ncbi:hypothetical protein FOS14_20620 [Skermania sp. ID1734]|uniref:hypothetical protein n=1 Tax=Skermania sp. ID1734 TaxID=2597516 RepID=UPI00117C6AE3|nr:hypothetical protein [Skermania sp. ID1734]TSD94427.1 hypothetical protein FOS14_20620 [Skermania sp. ID1734]
MSAVDVVTIILVAGLAIVTVAMAFLGLLGLMGTTRIERCPDCDHLAFRHADNTSSCLVCSHPRVVHPFHPSAA